MTNTYDTLSNIETTSSTHIQVKQDNTQLYTIATNLRNHFMFIFSKDEHIEESVTKI